MQTHGIDGFSLPRQWSCSCPVKTTDGLSNCTHCWFVAFILNLLFACVLVVDVEPYRLTVRKDITDTAGYVAIVRYEASPRYSMNALDSSTVGPRETKLTQKNADRQPEVHIYLILTLCIISSVGGRRFLCFARSSQTAVSTLLEGQCPLNFSLYNNIAVLYNSIRRSLNCVSSNDFSLQNGNLSFYLTSASWAIVSLGRNTKRR